jgi:SSS family solute:Na+ symporter
MAFIGLRSGKKVRSSGDFTIGGRKAGAVIVSGTIMGTLVGGASTIGTAQLAFNVGFSAWWFTLGAGLGCLVLGLFFAKPARKSAAETVSQIVALEYGPLAKTLSGASVSLGIFLNIVAQVLAGVALLASLFGISPAIAAGITILCMGSFVVSGGVWGAGSSGTAKTFLLYMAIIVGGTVAYTLSGGLGGLRSLLPPFPWFSLFGRGFATDASAGFSLLVGVVSTQTYIQAVLSAKSDASAVRGSLLGAILIPPIGIAGIIIGLFMKTRHPEIEAASAFPAFIIEYLPTWLGGVVLAALFIAVLGTGAGLALGIGVIVSRDFYAQKKGKKASDSETLLFSRLSIMAVLFFAALFTTGNLSSLILQWSYLSMGLRGAAILAPLMGALFFKGKIGNTWALASIVGGPSSMILWKSLFPTGLDPLLPGMAISFLCMAIGLATGALRPLKRNNS